MRIKSYFLLSLLYLLILGGCTREKLSDCIPPQGGVILKYSYWLNMDYANLFGAKVNDLKVFVFDRDGILCDTLSPAVVAGELNNDWTRQVYLDPGVYSFVTWGGDLGFSDVFDFTDSGSGMSVKNIVIGTTRLSDFRAGLKSITESMPQNQQLGRLFHGLQRDVEVKAGEVTTLVTPLVRDTKTVRVKIIGLDQLAQPDADESDFYMRLAVRNGQYNYDNVADSVAPLLVYEPHSRTMDGDTVKADISTLRLWRFRQGNGYSAPLLSVTYKPTDKVVCKDLDVTDLILSAKIPARDDDGHLISDAEGKPEMVYPTSEYLDRQDLFEILFEIKNVNGQLQFTVYVNGWIIQNIIPEP